MIGRILLTCLLLLGAAALAQPALEISQPEFDFGAVVSRTTVYHTSWFKSVGDDTLEIVDIKVGCDCAALPLPTRTLPPGDSMQVRFEWTTERSNGLDRRFPRIFTNASPDPVRMQFYANCVLQPDSVRPVTINPYRFEFTKLGSISRDSTSFVMTNLSTKDFAVHLITPLTGRLEIVYPDSLAAGAKASGHVRVKSEFADHEFEETVTFQFDHPNREPARFSIPVRQRFLSQSSK
jgi:hypothetical protein